MSEKSQKGDDQANWRTDLVSIHVAEPAVPTIASPPLSMLAFDSSNSTGNLASQVRETSCSGCGAEMVVPVNAGATKDAEGGEVRIRAGRVAVQELLTTSKCLRGKSLACPAVVRVVNVAIAAYHSTYCSPLPVMANSFRTLLCTLQLQYCDAALLRLCGASEP